MMGASMQIRSVLRLSFAPAILLGLGLWQGAQAQDTVIQPVGANAEPPSGTVASGDGFVISIDGAGPPENTPANAIPANTARQADVALSEADLRVTFDGLGVRRRLDLLVLSDAPVRPGQNMRVQSQMNYPAFVERGEVRVIDIGATGGSKTVLVVPVDPNGAVQFTVPEGADLAMTHRVYDARGRYDETAPRPLQNGPDAVAIEDFGDLAVEEGTSSLARQRIPIFGGAVTVSGDNVPSGARVQTLGEVITPDPTGSFVLQRILPPGDQAIPVQVVGAGPGTYIERIITIPRNDWFYTATVDLTYGIRFGNPTTATGDSA